MIKILIVDDEVQIRESLKIFLERNGYTISVAADGAEALNKISSETFNLVVMDIIMPEKDGVELLVEIRKDYKNLPVIAMTGGGRIGKQNYLQMAKALGASAVLTKPYDLDDFLMVINELLNE